MVTPGIREHMQQDLRNVMKARDRRRVEVLRATLGAIANAEAVPSDARPNVSGYDAPTEVARRELRETDVVAVVEGELAELRADVGRYREGANDAPIADLQARIAILVAYLA